MSRFGERPTATVASGTKTKLQPVRLLVVEGPDRGKQSEVREGTALIGTLADSNLALTDPTVSRRHAQVSLLGARLRVKDLESKNGTKYFGAKVSTIEVPVGATIEVGTTRVALLPAEVPEDVLSPSSELARVLHGRSPRMRRLFAEIERAAPTDAPVLIRGETGSGKECVARAIHGCSARASGPLVVLDCTSVQANLVQSTLFGHVKGAFTGAVKESPGALEEADGGTLFLDEVAELPLEMQPAFLRALDTQTYCRVGENRVRKSNFRILAATHHDLEELVREGRFHKGLYYRVAGLVLEVPPLRERPEDVPLLVELFAQRKGGVLRLSSSAAAAMCAYPWPGNVRELRNAVERAMALGTESVLPGLEPSRDSSFDFHRAREVAIKAFERTYLESLLERNRGSISAAAREAGLARSYFYELLAAHGLRGRKRDER